MNYAVKIGKTTVKLPKCTISVEERCNDVVESGVQYSRKEISVSELLQKELDFLENIIGHEVIASHFGEDETDMDVHEVDALCCDVVMAYRKPSMERKQKELEEQCAPVRKLFSDKNLAALMSAAAQRNAL